MLELRPSCEHCNKPLPAHSTEAMICSFECTFCRDCVETVLHNVCRSCGGGFCPRPIRPGRVWNNGLSVAKYPPGTRVVYKPVDVDAHRSLVLRVGQVAPEQR